MSQTKIFNVAKIIDSYKLVLNGGKADGIKEGFRFLIYSIGDEIFDPNDQKKSLGKLEVVKGTGKVIHVQEHMCTIESDTFESSRSIQHQNSYLYGSATTETLSPERKEFEQPNVNDYAKYMPSLLEQVVNS